MLRAAKWVAGRMMRLVPERILARIVPLEYRFDPSLAPEPTAAPDAAARLLIAPTNFAGQGWQWARAVTRHVPNAGAVNMVVRKEADFRHPADCVVPLGFYAASRRWQREQRRAVIENFTHVMIEAERQPFGAVLDESVTQQAEYLARHGLGVLMVCHGSDIRLPSRHIANNVGSPFLDSLAAVAPRLEETARTNREVLDHLGFPVFVSTPDLLLDVPHATWLPVVIDVDQWRSDASLFQRPRPVVVHAPSNNTVKGSELIDPVMRELDREGVIEYRRIEKVPFESMQSVYQGADIVLDQFRLGDYGVAACEAMAVGCVVVGNVSDHAREQARSAAGMRLPIVQATIDDVEDVLRAVMGDLDGAREAARLGPAFVEALHDGRRSATVLERYLS